jgi:hypothetical protein
MEEQSEELVASLPFGQRVVFTIKDRGLRLFTHTLQIGLVSILASVMEITSLAPGNVGSVRRPATALS